MQNENQQFNLMPVDNAQDSDDSSTSSACWGCTQGSLGFEYLVDDNFFDIDVF
jgi:hypothetical protein